MGKIFIIFTTVCILFSCQSENETAPLVFHFEQVERFIDVMDYLEAKDSSGFAKEELSDEFIESVTNNINDTLDRILMQGGIEPEVDFKEIKSSFSWLGFRYGISIGVAF